MKSAVNKYCMGLGALGAAALIAADSPDKGAATALDSDDVRASLELGSGGIRVGEVALGKSKRVKHQNNKL